MKKTLTLAALMAACLTLAGCVIVPDGPGGPRAHGYYYDHGCFHCYH